MTKQDGFSLIELMIVIAVIGVLASLALPYYQDYIARAHFAEVVSVSDKLKQVILINRQKSSCFDNAVSATGEEIVVGKYGTGEIVKWNGTTKGATDCGIRYKFYDTGVSDRLAGKMVEFSVNGNAVIFNETTTTVEDRYIPVALK